MAAASPIEVFCSYAHQDEALQQQLKNHLSSLLHQGRMEFWHDRLLLPGMEWAREIDEHLNRATLILALVSADFLASRYCYGIEMKRALERHKAREAVVIPILLRPVEWQDEPLALLHALPNNGRPVTSWSNRDKALANVATGIREALNHLPRLLGSPSAPTGSPSVSASAQPSLWNVPFPRNPFFTGREEELHALHTQLASGSTAAIGQMQAISGLGGIGKTQLAVEYAYRHRQEYQAVLWMRADTLEALTASASELARLLALPERDAREQEVVVGAVRRWLATQPGYLLILDNLDEPSVLVAPAEPGQPRSLSPFVPPTPAGHILITTRAADLTGLGLGLAHPLTVPVFSPEQGAALLLARAGRPTAGEQEQALARQLSLELGGLALALEQAGAYLAASGMSLADYLTLFRTRSHDLLSRRTGQDYPHAVATTWDLSFQRVQERAPAAAELLRCCAFLAPDAIPEEILNEGARHLGKLLAPVAADPLRLSDALAALRAYSLLTRDPEARTLTVHRLVQTILRDRLPPRARTQWMRRVVLATNAAFPSIEYAAWPACERLLPHALVCATWIEQAGIQTREAALLLNQTGSYLYARGQYGQAAPLFQRALAIREQVLGPQHPHTAQSLNNLAELYRAQGDYAQAEPLFQRALAINEQVLGPQHPHTATCLNNLAELYRAQGRYEQAEPLLQRALAIREQVLGPQHPLTATCLHNLAALYHAQGDYAQAEPLFQRALAIHEQVLGPQHPDTATSLNNLAGLYRAQGDYAQAEPLYQRALAICEQVLGPQHPHTALSLHNLAGLYRAQGNYAQAEPLLQRALAIREHMLGPQHPDTATSLNNLALLYDDQGRYGQAEPLLQRALAIYEQVLGPQHPTTQIVRRNYEGLLRKMGRG